MNIILAIGKIISDEATIFIGSILFGLGTTFGILAALKMLKIDIVHKVVVGKTEDVV